jgi:hypothetical protein
LTALDWSKNEKMICVADESGSLFLLDFETLAIMDELST